MTNARIFGGAGLLLAVAGAALAERAPDETYAFAAGDTPAISSRVVTPGEVLTIRDAITQGFVEKGCTPGKDMGFMRDLGEERVLEVAEAVSWECWYSSTAEEWMTEISLIVPNLNEGSYRLLLGAGEAGGDNLLLGGVVVHVVGESDLRATPRVVETNLVSDPGFEAGTPNGSWEEGSTNFGSPICSLLLCGSIIGDGPYSGDYWAWFGGVGAEETGFVSQTVDLPAGETGLLDFYLQIPAVDTDGYFKVLLDGQALFEVTEQDVGDFGDYRRVVLGLGEYADGGSHTLRFEGYSGVAATGDTSFFLDETSLVSHSGAGPCATDVTTLGAGWYGGGEKTVSSEQGVVSSGETVVAADGKLDLRAPSVQLKPGFSAKTGAQMLISAETVTCI